MTQHRTKGRFAKTTLEILSTPACKRCGQRTRFVGLEADVTDPHADLCTYECTACQHVQVMTLVRANGATSTDSAA